MLRTDRPIIFDLKFDKFLVHQFSSNRTFVDIVTQQDEAFNPVESGESSNESEIECISPVKSELNRALDF